MKLNMHWFMLQLLKRSLNNAKESGMFILTTIYPIVEYARISRPTTAKEKLAISRKATQQTNKASEKILHCLVVIFWPKNDAIAGIPIDEP